MIYTVFHFHNICSSCDCEFWDRWSPACDYRLAQWLEQHRDSVNIWWTNETKTGQWLSASVARKPVCWALLSRPHTASLHQFYSTLILKYSVCEANMPYPGFFFFFFCETGIWTSELRAFHLQSRHFAAWATPPVHFALVILQMELGGSVFAWAGLELWSSPSQPPK
jgi:hypothetical protein